jgi:phospholipid/cholesterol/gamma-HCH transport system permease protein
MPAITRLMSVIAGMIAVTQFGGTSAGYWAQFQAHFTTVDLIANVFKTLAFGFIIAVICAYKGMNASGGSEGVGRAVNQAVVFAFVAVWVFNFAFNSTYQAAFPAAQEFR